MTRTLRRPAKGKNAVDQPAPAADAARHRPAEQIALLAPAEASASLGVTPKLLERWRSTGEGPPFVRLSRKTIRYRIGDLEEFVAKQVRASTAA